VASKGGRRKPIQRTADPSADPERLPITDLLFGVPGFEYRVPGSGFGTSGSGLRVPGSRCRVSGFQVSGCRVSNSGVDLSLKLTEWLT